MERHEFFTYNCSDCYWIDHEHPLANDNPTYDCMTNRNPDDEACVCLTHKEAENPIDTKRN